MAKRTQIPTLGQLPPEFIIHPRIVVSRSTGEAILEQLSRAEPTPALRELMAAAKTI